MSFKLTPKQEEAFRIIARPEVTSMLLYGGSQSAKSFFAVYYILMRALMCEGSVHVICRRRLVDIKSTIMLQLVPDVLKRRFPGVDFFESKACKMRLGAPMYLEFSNGSKVYFIGLEDQENSDKVLGRTITTFLIDEASEVGYAGFIKLQTRLSQNNRCKKTGIVTLNPTSKKHWVYRLFFEKVEPRTGALLKNGYSYESLQMNPNDNLENLPKDYVMKLEGFSEKEKERFLYGRFSDVSEGAVYATEIQDAIEEGRVADDIKYDPDRYIYFVMDLGINDKTAVWVVQFHRDRIKFLDYVSAVNESIIDVLERLLERGWNPRGVYLPHDGRSHWVGSGATVEQVVMRFSDTMPDGYRFFVRVLPPLKLWQGINAARILFARCYFKTPECEEGIDCLKNYKFEYNERMGISADRPQHDWSSHGADAFRYAVMAYSNIEPEVKKKPRDKNQVYFSDLISKEKVWN
jgi:phage terminase large subunit